MRKHDEVIRAWLEGKDIQFYRCIGSCTEWVDLNTEMLTNPITYPDRKWRIKPDAKTITIPIFSNASNVAAYFDKEAREIVIEYEEEAL